MSDDPCGVCGGDCRIGNSFGLTTTCPSCHGSGKRAEDTGFHDVTKTKAAHHRQSNKAAVVVKAQWPVTPHGVQLATEVATIRRARARRRPGSSRRSWSTKTATVCARRPSSRRSGSRFGRARKSRGILGAVGSLFPSNVALTRGIIFHTLDLAVRETWGRRAPGARRSSPPDVARETCGPEFVAIRWYPTSHLMAWQTTI